MLSLILAVIILSFSFPAIAQNVNEYIHQGCLCRDMQTEVQLAAQLRADCISETHAIEIDFAQKWKEGIGQALAYGVASGLRPGLVLICERDQASCNASSFSAQQTLSALGIGTTLWECLPTDKRLEQCDRLEFGDQQ